MKINELKGKEITFAASHVVEFFPVPLPDDLDGIAVTTEADLFRASHINGYDELFLAQGPTIEAKCEEKTYQFSIEDFLRWQLERMNEETLFLLIAKAESDVTQILDYDIEYDKDPDYYPEGWLNIYAQDEYPGKAVAYITRLRQEVPDEFYATLIKSILDDTYGLLNHSFYETEIDENLDDVRASYAEWEEPLMIVSTGRFFPYISADLDHNLMMDDYRLEHMYVRNHDEGDPL